MNNQPQVMPLAIMKLILAYFYATGKLFNAANLKLNKALVSPSPTLQLSNMVEPTFTGYAPQTAIVFGSAGNQPTELGARSFGASVPFLATAVTTPETIQGWFLTDTANTELLLYVPFVTPVPVAAPGDFVEVDCQLWFSGN